MTRLLTVVMFLLFISCSKDGNGISLLGKWKLVEVFDDNPSWGGCSCWRAVEANYHVLEFRPDGTYRYIPSLISSFSGCTGQYEIKNDSILSWNACAANVTDDKISIQFPFLTIEKQQFAGLHKYKYKRL